MNLVYIDNNRPVTDSLTIAETFKKRHADVLRSIESMECSQEFTERNFALSEYRDSTGRTLPKYLITQDGFTFLAMGYTGKEAALFKEMYINEFNRMQVQLLTPQYVIPQTYVEALRLAADLGEEKEKVTAEKLLLEAKIEADKPLIHFAESLQISNDSILIGELAKLLKQNGINVGQTRLFQTLRSEGYLMKQGEQRNMPTQKSMELKIMEIKTGSRQGSEGAVHITRTPKITGKGQMYFINKFKGQLIAN